MTDALQRTDDDDKLAPKIAREIGEWLYLRCGDDEAKAERLLAHLRAEYRRHRDLLEGLCLGPPK